MKKNALIIVLGILLIAACSKKNSDVNTDTTKTKGLQDLHSYALLGLDSPFISIDSANKMISSYQNSIDLSGSTPDLQSLIVDADALRYYLSNTDIKHVKLMFAHKLSYIRNGGVNEYAGYKSNALTIVIAGFSGDGNYIYSPQGAVMDFCEPCPANCPQNGTASYNSLIPY